MLREDLELSREDIQLLSSRDALVALFAKLGYDTNERLVQNVAAMGFSSDNLKSAIIHIEREYYMGKCVVWLRIRSCSSG